jgi:hypothetical protein
MYPWRRDDVETDDRASAEVAEDAEWDETEEKVRSGEEYEEMAGVAGTEGEGEVERTGGEDRSSTSCGSMAISETGVAATVQWGLSIGVECVLGLNSTGTSECGSRKENPPEFYSTKKRARRDRWSHGQRRNKGHEV